MKWKLGTAVSDIVTLTVNLHILSFSLSPTQVAVFFLR